MWTATEEDEEGLLTVSAVGALDDGDMIPTKFALKRQMAQQRVRRGRARLLFDLSRYAGALDGVIARFQDVDGDLLQSAGDCIALVLPRSLDKTTARPLLESPDQPSVSLSINTART